jgi:hypothetical protein
MFESIPDNCDRELVKELFWYCVSNNDTLNLFKMLESMPRKNISRHLPCFVAECITLYRKWHGEVKVSFQDRLAIVLLVSQAIEDPEKFGL